MLTTMIAALLLAGQAAPTQPAGAAAPAATPQLAAANRDKVMCKKFPVSGSLVQTTKVCKSQWEWQRDRENLRNGAGSGACNAPGGGAC